VRLGGLCLGHIGTYGIDSATPLELVSLSANPNAHDADC
jgi:hypothetical protein